MDYETSRRLSLDVTLPSRDPGSHERLTLDPQRILTSSLPFPQIGQSSPPVVGSDGRGQYRGPSNRTRPSTAGSHRRSRGQEGTT